VIEVTRSASFRVGVLAGDGARRTVLGTGLGGVPLPAT